MAQFMSVIHADSVEQALRNVDIAKSGGVDGIFLINHSIVATTLLEIYGIVRQAHPEVWIGLNLLDLNPMQAIRVVPDDVDAIWVDDGGLRYEYGSVDDGVCVDRAKLAKHELEVRRNFGFKGLLFGGVNFKGQPAIPNHYLAAKYATGLMDVVTTSGAGTGTPPQQEKIKEMSDGIRGSRGKLAVASGISPENVHVFRGHVDYFLVATGISDSFTELNYVKVRQMANCLHR